MPVITKQLCQKIRTDVQAALNTISIEGISLKATNISYSENNGTLKVEFATMNSDGEVIDKERVALEERADMLGFTYGDTIDDDGVVYKVVGYKVRARKNNIIIESTSNQKRYVAPISHIKRHLASAATN